MCFPQKRCRYPNQCLFAVAPFPLTNKPACLFPSIYCALVGSNLDAQEICSLIEESLSSGLRRFGIRAPSLLAQTVTDDGLQTFLVVLAKGQEAQRKLKV